MFPHMDQHDGLQLAIRYFIDPFHAVGNFFGENIMSPETTTAKVFETHLSQLFNYMLYLGISSSAFTGSINMTQITRKTSGIKDNPFKLTAENTHPQDIVRCNRPWLAVRIVSSVVIFCFALVGAYLHIITIAPDLITFISVAVLQNKA